MDVRRGLAVVTLLAATGALALSAPATAGHGLSNEKARQTTARYAAELCLADQPRCKSFEVAGCARNSSTKVTCRVVEHLRKQKQCSYRLAVRKHDGKVTGRVKHAHNTCF